MPIDQFHSFDNGFRTCLPSDADRRQKVNFLLHVFARASIGQAAIIAAAAGVPKGVYLNCHSVGGPPSVISVNDP